MSGKSVYRCGNIWSLSPAIFQVVGFRLLEMGCIRECGKKARCRVAKLAHLGVWVCVGGGFIMYLTAYPSTASYWGDLENSATSTMPLSVVSVNIGLVQDT